MKGEARSVLYLNICGVPLYSEGILTKCVTVAIWHTCPRVNHRINVPRAVMDAQGSAEYLDCVPLICSCKRFRAALHIPHCGHFAPFSRAKPRVCLYFCGCCMFHGRYSAKSALCRSYTEKLLSHFTFRPDVR